MQNETYLSVIVPAYNEERRLPGSLESIFSYLALQPYRSEVIVVDDGSKDRTSDIAESVGRKHKIPLRILKNESNQGKGYSVRRGLLEAKGRICLFSDADLSTPIEEFEKMKEHLDGGWDIAIGSRGLSESKVEIHQSWYRETMGKTFNILVRLITVGGLHDTQCGFKAFRSEFVKQVCPRLRIDGWAFDVELLMAAQMGGYRIKEVPVRWRNDENTRVNAVVDSTKMFLELLKIRWMAVRGTYRDLKKTRQ